MNLQGTTATVGSTGHVQRLQGVYRLRAYIAETFDRDLRTDFRISDDDAEFRWVWFN